MRILWIKVGGLWPLNTGGRLRSFHTLAQLSKRHQVTLLTTHAPGEDPQALRDQLPLCESIISIPFTLPKWNSLRFLFILLRSWFSPLPVDLVKCRVTALRQEALRLLEAQEVDLCVADFLVAMANVPTVTQVPVIYFAHNVEHMIWKRLAVNTRGVLKRALLHIEWRKMRRIEARTCRRVRLTVAVSPQDRDMLAALAPASDVCAVPTGVDINYFANSDIAEVHDRIVFVGSMDWHPNEDAVLHFIDDILPEIRLLRPSVSMTVVGRNPSMRLRQAAKLANVSITGTVDDVRTHVAEAAVVVVPLRVGGGTRLKIFEALAMGKAVVSTTIGAEGLPLQDGVHFVCADAAHVFAHAVVSLLVNAPLRHRLGTTGRKLVEKNYGWIEVVAQFESLLEEATQPATILRETSTISATQRQQFVTLIKK